MKNLLTHNWQAKLVCLGIAFAIWVYLKNSVTQGSFIDQVLSGTYSPGR